MARYERFTFLCNKEERRMLADLAKQLSRSQSDTVRLLIRGAVRELADTPTGQQVKERTTETTQRVTAQ